MSPKLAISFDSTPLKETTIGPDDRSPAVKVVETVSEVAGVDPTDMPLLAHTIDPDVINQFVESTDSETDPTAGLCFTYSDWNVFLRADGTIIIGDPTENTVTTPLF